MANAVMRLARDNEELATQCRAPFWLSFLDDYLDPLNAVPPLTPLTPNTVELIPTIGALFPRGGPVQDPVLTRAVH